MIFGRPKPPQGPRRPAVDLDMQGDLEEQRERGGKVKERTDSALAEFVEIERMTEERTRR